MALPETRYNRPLPPGARPSLVIFLPNLIGGGAERSHVNMAADFVAAGYDVTFLLYRAEGALLDLLPPAVRVIALGSRSSLTNLMPLTRFLQRERPDFLIANLGHSNIIAVWAALLARVGTKIITTEHNVLALDCADKPFWDWRYKLLPFLYRRFIGRADALVAVSEGVANALAAHTGVARARISVIYNPVITDDFAQHMQAPAMHPWFAPGSPPVFLGVGRLIPVKDFTTLIKAFAQLLQQKDARLILLGDGPMRTQLAAEAEQLGIADKVNMPGFQINPLPYIHRAAALVLSSRHEGFGNVLVEALACGTPVISTDCPFGPGEILARGRYGRMVAIGDTEAMAQAMRDVIDSPPGDPAPLRARAEDFTARKAADAYLKLLRELTGMQDAAASVRHDVIMIGQFPEDITLIKGGVQASTYGLAKAFQNQNQFIGTLCMLALPLKPQTAMMHKYVDGIDTTFLNAPYKFLASSIVHLPATLRRMRASKNPVIHVHGTGLFQAVLCWAARWNNLPIVWTLHGITEKENLMQWQAHHTLANGLRYLFYRFLERSMLRITPDIIVDTPYVVAAIPATRSQVHVIPQGIFMDELIPLRDQERDPNLVLSLGVMAPRKGHHLLLESFAALRQKVPQARLIIAGALAIADYPQRLERRAQELGIADAVEVRVNLPRSQILSLLGRAKIFALHSEEESQGIALCEAMATGLPIVATRVGGIPFVVDDGVSGILTDFGAIKNFADGMAQLLADPTRYAQMAAAARAASAHFDWNNIATDVAEIYAQAVKTSGRA